MFPGCLPCDPVAAKGTASLAPLTTPATASFCTCLADNLFCRKATPNAVDNVLSPELEALLGPDLGTTSRCLSLCRTPPFHRMLVINPATKGLQVALSQNKAVNIQVQTRLTKPPLTISLTTC